MALMMDVTSDVKQKLRKMREGCVFSSPTVFVTEMLQNAYRARAKRVDITLEDDVCTISDNGSGCRDPSAILTIDYSEWDTTDEGFGIGFWSILAIPDITHCVVTSRTWRATIDVDALFTTGTPQARVERVPSSPGFTVTIKAEYFRSNRYEILNEIYRVGELQPFDTHINGCMVPKKDLYADVCGDYVQEFSTRYFSAKLSVHHETYYQPELYYEKRKVCDIPRIYGVTGVVEMKPRALNLREPDRKGYSSDDKAVRFIERLQQCCQELYADFVKTVTDAEIDRYAPIIDRILPVEAYERYIMTDECATIVIPQVATTIDTSHRGAISASVTGLVEQDYNLPDYDDTSSIVGEQDIRYAKEMARLGSPQRRTLRESIRNVAKKTWVNASELEMYDELKARAEYYGVRVFVAKNVLQRNVFEKYDVPHISEIDNGITRHIRIRDASPRTKKEIEYLRLLIPICNFYNLPHDTFAIGRIRCIIETRLREQLIDRTELTVRGVCKDDKIILNRRELNLKRFRLYGRGTGIGQHELKALMATLPTIAHELAHLLERTEDNTVEHFKAEGKILQELTTMYATQ
jgi:hypothetical protein